MSRVAWYCATNVAFVLLAVIGLISGSGAGVRPLYVILLFALCSSSILYVKRLNDRYALLGIFLGAYFMFYGVVDFVQLVSGQSAAAKSSGVLSKAEALILIGGALAVAAYHFMCRLQSRVRAGQSKDWPEHFLITVGCALWVVCTWLAWEFKVNVLQDTSIESQQRGLASLSGIRTSIIMMGLLLQPLSILMLVYAQRRYKRRYLVPVVITVVLVQLVFGFVVDIKGEALIGAALVIMTKLLVDGKVPLGWLVAFGAFVALAFPVMQANRTVRMDYAINRAQAAEAIGQVLARARDLSKQVNSGPSRANTFFERMSLKGSVELIVAKTGKDVAFQYGHTLSPLVTAFIPRLIWPTKPDVQVGRLMNSEFQLSPDASTYISSSHLGDLYWNFGSMGVVLGMPLIGLLLGFLGARFNLADEATLTRLMVLVATIQLLVLGFEGSIAPRYVVWMRSMVGIALLHGLFARVTAGGRAAADSAGPELRPLPAVRNLMR